jgi:hypothetical protein
MEDYCQIQHQILHDHGGHAVNPQREALWRGDSG